MSIQTAYFWCIKHKKVLIIHFYLFNVLRGSPSSLFSHVLGSTVVRRHLDFISDGERIPTSYTAKNEHDKNTNGFTPIIISIYFSSQINTSTYFVHWLYVMNIFRKRKANLYLAQFYFLLSLSTNLWDSYIHLSCPFNHTSKILQLFIRPTQSREN